jgi:hypothetical protein
MVRRLLLTAGLIMLSACGPQSKPAATTAPPPAEARADGYTLTASAVSPLKTGAPATVTLRLADEAGATIGADRLETVHEHKLHVMIVDAGLEDYAHVHPAANTDGSFTVSFTPKLDRPYRLWADFHPTGDGRDDAGHAHHGAHKHDDAKAVKIGVDLPGGSPFTASATQNMATQVVAGGLKFQLAGEKALKVDHAINLNVFVTDERGQSFGKLEPIMGAYGHLVGFDAGAARMVHAHPQGFPPENENARGGPELSFAVKPTSAGPMRIFLQVKANGQEITAPFTVMVAP